MNLEFGAGMGGVGGGGGDNVLPRIIKDSMHYFLLPTYTVQLEGFFRQ